MMCLLINPGQPNQIINSGNTHNMTYNQGTPHALQKASKQIFRKIARDTILAKKSGLEFDWKNKWLKGDEYAYMLENVDLYCKKFSMPKLPSKTHPLSIYTQPQNGMIYFVEGNSVGSEFGFPRVDIKKRFRWKKMNFTTDLPKRRPRVTYIVASAVKCEKFFPNSRHEGPSYRMHAVIINKNGSQSQRYKLKGEAINTADVQESNQNSCNSTNYSLVAGEFGENQSPNRHFNYGIPTDHMKERKEYFKENKKNPSKSYILCHIRKIDQNYKISKKRRPYKDTEQLYEECMPKAYESNPALDKLLLKTNGLTKQNSDLTNKPFMKDNENRNFIEERSLKPLYLSTKIPKNEENNMLSTMNYLDIKSRSAHISQNYDLYSNKNTLESPLRSSKKSSEMNSDSIVLLKKDKKMEYLTKLGGAILNDERDLKVNRKLVMDMDDDIGHLNSKLNNQKPISNNNNSNNLLNGNKGKLTMNGSSSQLISHFNLDETLTQEMLCYDNENYDYYKIFNAIISKKNWQANQPEMS